MFMLCRSENAPSCRSSESYFLFSPRQAPTQSRLPFSTSAGALKAPTEFRVGIGNGQGFVVRRLLISLRRRHVRPGRRLFSMQGLHTNTRTEHSIDHRISSALSMVGNIIRSQCIFIYVRYKRTKLKNLYLPWPLYYDRL